MHIQVLGIKFSRSQSRLTRKIILVLFEKIPRAFTLEGISKSQKSKITTNSSNSTTPLLIPISSPSPGHFEHLHNCESRLDARAGSPRKACCIFSSHSPQLKAGSEVLRYVPPPQPRVGNSRRPSVILNDSSFFYGIESATGTRPRQEVRYSISGVVGLYGCPHTDGSFAIYFVNPVIE